MSNQKIPDPLFLRHEFKSLVRQVDLLMNSAVDYRLTDILQGLRKPSFSIEESKKECMVTD